MMVNTAKDIGKVKPTDRQGLVLSLDFPDDRQGLQVMLCAHQSGGL